MAEISVLLLSEIQNYQRWDTEFYKPYIKQLTAYLKLNNGKPLADFVLQARRGQTPEYSSVGIIPVIRTVNVRELGFSDTRQEFVTSKFYEDNLKAHIEQNDIVVTSTGIGTLGRCFCNTSTEEYFADNHITILKLKPDVDYAFLTAVLQSSIGTAQFEQWQRGSSGQIEIYPEDIINILIPNFDDNFCSKISLIWQNAIKLIEQSVRFYPEAEAEMLERMGWNKLAKHSIELHYIHQFSGIKIAERGDAEYFQPQYKRLRAHLQQVGALPLGKFCTIPNRGVQPEFVDGGDVLVLDSKSIRPQGTTPSEDERTNLDFYLSSNTAKARVRRDDVLLNSTGRGTLGRAACYQSEQLAIADNHVSIIRPNNHICLPVYLSLFLNSPAGLAQSEMYQAGSSGQLELYPQHITQFLIYLPKNDRGDIDLKWQEKLAEKVNSANRAKIEAQANLEEAKQLVEEKIAQELAKSQVN